MIDGDTSGVAIKWSRWGSSGDNGSADRSMALTVWPNGTR